MEQAIPPRVAAIRAMFDHSGRGLEIGASYNPLFPKSEGFAVETVDHATAEGLRAKYAQDPTVDCARIEEVDHVWDGRPLGEVVGRRGCYDFIAASHVIEHTPDLLGFVDECAGLLAPGGVLFLAVPDKRRCFDVFRPLSTTGAILQAHAERRARHVAGSLFDYVAYSATLAGRPGWSLGDSGDLAMSHELESAWSAYEHALGSDGYHDCHAWIFCPSSFRLAVEELNQVGALDLREVAFRPTAGVEFHVTLGRSGAGCGLSRETLLRRIQDELAEFPTPRPSARGIADDLRADLEIALAEAAAATAALHHAQARVAALERSTSWRITAPLRAAARMLRP